MNEESIFAAAIEKAPDQRPAFLREACGNDPDLRERVEALLAAHLNPDSILESPAAPDLAATADLPHEPSGTHELGTVIGNYKLLQQLGEGGMGVVFMAEQLRPVTRRVAVKIIKQGMDTRRFVARFEAERQALALMDHPNIARVLDAGCTDTGRPYFVMELVKGIPITQFCDENRVTMQQRLELFLSVCQAVQHAHQKGIIHRDLKPSNVLVALYDNRPVPKVIDFGVAKATNQRLTERTLFTQVGQIVGTWEYMSPEQAVLNQLDVDTRTDIYSLGVILYELLTGVTPLDRERLRSAALDETLRMIRDEEPLKPSTRVSSLGQTATATAAYRGTNAPHLAQTLRGDLDWIVMKALDKDRARRYETASTFAADIHRYLNQEPIQARPPSTVYRLRKFARRNRGPVAAGVAVILALNVAVFGVGMGYVNARREAEKALQLNEELREVLIDDALAAAMSGSEKLAQRAIDRAILAEASPAWIEMIRGQLALYSGKMGDAIAHLEEACRLDRDKVASRSMLSVAHIFGGSDIEFTRQLRALEDMSPKQEEDFLFLGQAQLYQDTSLGLATLRSAIQRSDSPLARAILADACCHRAAEEGNLAAARSAISYAEAARTFMPDNGYVLMADLFGHVVAIRLTRELGESTVRLRQTADDVAAALGRLENFALGHHSRAIYLETIGRVDAAVKEGERSVERGGVGFMRSQAAALLYRVRCYSEAADLLTAKEAQRSGFVAMARAELLALTTAGRQEAVDIYQNVARIRGKGSWSIPETILLAAADRDFRRARCRQVLQSTNRLDPWEKTVLRFIADDMTAKDLLQEATSARNRRNRLCVSHKLLGLKSLIQGERDKAIQHFQECVATNYPDIDYFWAAAYLARLNADPNWPACSESE